MVGGKINQSIVDALKKEYDLANKVTFKDVAPAMCRAIQSKEASASWWSSPSEKYLSLVRRFFRDNRNAFDPSFRGVCRRHCGCGRRL